MTVAVAGALGHWNSMHRLTVQHAFKKLEDPGLVAQLWLPELAPQGVLRNVFRVRNSVVVEADASIQTQQVEVVELRHQELNPEALSSGSRYHQPDAVYQCVRTYQQVLRTHSLIRSL